MDAAGGRAEPDGADRQTGQEPADPLGSGHADLLHDALDGFAADCGWHARGRAVMCSPSTTVDRGPKKLDGAATEIFETSFAAPRMSVTVTRYASSYAEPPERTTIGDL